MCVCVSVYMCVLCIWRCCLYAFHVCLLPQLSIIYPQLVIVSVCLYISIYLKMSVFVFRRDMYDFIRILGVCMILFSIFNICLPRSTRFHPQLLPINRLPTASSFHFTSTLPLQKSPWLLDFPNATLSHSVFSATQLPHIQTHPLLTQPTGL